MNGTYAGVNITEKAQGDGSGEGITEHCREETLGNIEPGERDGTYAGADGTRKASRIVVKALWYIAGGKCGALGKG